MEKLILFSAMNEAKRKGLVVIHGGCGIIGAMDAAREQECRGALAESANAAMRQLSSGGSALAAVVEAVKVLEDCPQVGTYILFNYIQFNCGKGSVFTRDGTNEMDAGVMDGYTGAVGGVSTLTNVKNPICAAHCVLKHSVHSLLCGPGAEKFAAAHGCVTEAREYFFTQHRYHTICCVLQSCCVIEHMTSFDRHKNRKQIYTRGD
ncbi:unnamed protein product, partial [Anisakis simplex]|uniref:Isoaspartyl peptidase/L-asparaginase (inferred by orthology to a human protein) n=1 Tax=Anisakis simplex TaxID=6269 RepID=A0A0M3J900_ANISI